MTNSMKNQEQLLLEVLRKGILEIRVLTSTNGPTPNLRLNRLANILHNIPQGLTDIESFDFKLLTEELDKYDREYNSVGNWVSKIQ